MDNTNELPYASKGRERTDPETATRFFEEVREAVELLEYAVSQGRRVADAIILRIKKAQSYLAEGALWPKDEDRADFEAAYRDLAQFMLPITAATLRATRDRPGGKWWLRPWRASTAKRFSRWLYFLVLLCAAGIVADQYLASTASNVVQGQASAARSPAGGANSGVPVGVEATLRLILTPLMPFLYGLLGALVYLLKSAHGYIADRTFDLYRIPEYYNRMVLGFVSGGVILVFPQQGTASSNLIAFLVGYNTDYLFQLIERLASAVFPKASSSDQQPGAPGVAKVDIPIPAIKAGASGNGSVVLAGAAPGGGVPVTLAAPPEVALAASSVSVSQGSTTANFTFTVSTTATVGSQLTITATANGTSASASITVA